MPKYYSLTDLFPPTDPNRASGLAKACAETIKRIGLKAKDKGDAETIRTEWRRFMRGKFALHMSGVRFRSPSAKEEIYLDLFMPSPIARDEILIMEHNGMAFIIAPSPMRFTHE